MSDTHSSNSTIPAGNPVDALWGVMTLNNGNAVWYATVGIILQAMIISSIFGKAFEYFDYFKMRDNPYLIWGIGFGTVLAACTVGITCAETYVMVYQKTLNTGSAIRFLVLGDITNLLLGTLFNTAASIYYSWRAYKMLGSRKWTIGIFAVCLAAQFIAAMVAVGDGYTCPKLTPNNLPKFQTFMHGNVEKFQIWGSITTAVDGSLCLLMTIMLFKSKDGIFHQESRLFNKLVSTIYETMLPPVLCLLLYQASTKMGGNPLSDFRKIITCILPVLYFHSLLYTLVGRKRSREILNAKLSREGITPIAGSDNYKGSNSGKFNFTVTSGGGGNGSNSNVGGRVLEEGNKSDIQMKDIPNSPQSFIWDGRK